MAAIMTHINPAPEPDGSEDALAVPAAVETSLISLPAPVHGSEIFLTDPPSPAPLPRPSPARPGPGLLEAIFWMISAATITFLGQLAGMLLLVAMYPEALQTGWEAVQLLMRQTQTDSGRTLRSIPLEEIVSALFSDNSLRLILLVGLLASLLFSFASIRVRCGRNGLKQLGWQLPSAVQLFAILGLVLPLALLCTALFYEVDRWIPGSTTALETSLGMLAGAPLPLLLIMLAVLPALWEELFFRGFLGQGLIGRHGYLAGVLLTSVLFGIMHGNPAQSIAVIPLGVVLHYLYLTTRSLWAPLLLHFLNNGLAVLKLKLDADSGSILALNFTPLPLPLLTVCITVSLALLLLLWQTRTRFVSESGEEWTPGYPTAHPLPASVAGVFFRVRESPRKLLVFCSAVCLCGFIGVMWQLSAATVFAAR